MDNSALMTAFNVMDLMKQRLMGSLEPFALEIYDESHHHIGHAGAKNGGHYRVKIGADIFNGSSLIKQHRMVYNALGDLMHNRIHALSIEIISQ